ncbi:MAG: beta-N-acetylhexosaminidase [Chloroflexi bacterium]|nr:beta-N-acetylhexosaminidase [Chloroflexota bacterium]
MQSIAEKVGQMTMVGFEGLTPPRHILAWLESGRIGGVYLFARNIESPAQVRRLVATCRRAAKFPILVGIDQEGGSVARLREGFTESPGAMALGASGDRQLAEDVAAMMGAELTALGINWNLAPVADLARRRDNPSIGTRAVGRDPQLVSDFVSAQVRGFQRAGLAATVKHFPGLGNSVIDTHVASAKVSGSLSTLYREDLLPFEAAIAAGVSCVMLTHVLYEELDSELPATLSPRIVDGLLRERLAYDGAVCTDCMEMKAITDSFAPGESAVLAVLAGVDMVMFSHSRAAQEAAFDALLEAAKAGRLPEGRIEQSLARIQALKERFPLEDAPALDIVGGAQHRSLAAKAARAGVVMIKRGEALPLSSRARLALIEFAAGRQRETVEADTPTPLASYLSQRRPHIACFCLDRAGAENNRLMIKSIASDAETLILVTRDAHLQPAQLQLAQLVCDSANQVVLVCARNPYDAGRITGADTVFCSNGDSVPSLQATVDALCGDFIPTGALTVAIR